MSMSTRVVGIRNLDGRFAKMIAVKEACEEANIDYPSELKKYFGANEVDESVEYLRAKFEEIDINENVEETAGDGNNNWTVDLSNLPADVKAIRFTNGY